MRIYSYLLAFLFVVFSATNVSSQEREEIKIGVLTDVQFCDCPPLGVRYYRLSLAKLDSCITTLNDLPLNAVFHLGDMTDRYAESLDSILPRFAKFKAPVNLVLGNHEYMIARDIRPALQQRIGLKDRYYYYDIGSWRFIILDGNDLSFFAPQTREQRKERNLMVISLYEKLQFNGLPWNGGVGRLQMQWLEEKIKEAELLDKKVIVACHFPLIAKKNHTLFNNNEMLNLLTKYKSVKAYFCGHYHDGSYAEYNGIHLINFKGMVDTVKNSFAVVTLTNDSIIVKGYGREISRNLSVRK